MIVCGIFTIAGIISWGQLVSDREASLSGTIALICWTIASLAGAGVIS